MRLAGVVLDWAGTVVDHGSQAPVETLRAIFLEAGVPVELSEARAPMGLAKKTHIEAVLAMTRVRDAWRHAHGRFPDHRDVNDLYAAFIPRQIELLESHSELISGVPAAVDRMRSRGLAIGTSTGYTRPMLDYLLERAAPQGFVPDASLCPDDVPAGRPAPWMCYLNAIRLNVYPLAAMVKIGDTIADIEEGLHAGMWTIGITRTGNETGLTEAEWRSAPEAERTAMLAAAERKFAAAGAHFTAESVAECDALLDRIQHSLDRGEVPSNYHAGSAHNRD